MSNKGLFILVEGSDDETFVEKVIKQELEKRLDWVKIYKYAEQRAKSIRCLLRSAKSMNADYIYFKDKNSEPCVSNRKQDIIKDCKYIDCDKIVIVEYEIESWYLAGLSDVACKKLHLRIPNETDLITKERFNEIIPKQYRPSKKDFMIEVLNNFSIEVASQKNRSFKYFRRKFMKP